MRLSRGATALRICWITAALRGEAALINCDGGQPPPASSLLIPVTTLRHQRLVKRDPATQVSKLAVTVLVKMLRENVHGVSETTYGEAPPSKLLLMHSPSRCIPSLQVLVCLRVHYLKEPKLSTVQKSRRDAEKEKVRFEVQLRLRLNDKQQKFALTSSCSYVRSKT